MDTNIKNPTVSIVMATYNQARFIGSAIESVLAQTFTDWELLIIDDASTDETAKIVADYISKEKANADATGITRIKYIRQPQNVGISRNRNTGLTHCRGKYIAVLDSDDMWLDPSKLAAQVAYLDTHPSCGLVGTWAKTIDDTAAEIATIEPASENKDIRDIILFQNQFVHSSVMFRQEILEKIKIRTAEGVDVYYDPARLIGEDYDLWLRIGLHSELANIPQYMTGYRIHGAGITKQKRRRADWDHIVLMMKYWRAYPLKKGLDAGLALLHKRLFNQP